MKENKNQLKRVNLNQAKKIRKSFFYGNSDINELSIKYFLPVNEIKSILKNKSFKEQNYVKSYIG